MGLGADLDWLNAVAGLFVGILVGLTGVGGGSLMSPILILLFGIAPVTAVGTDLWFASITKMVGGVVHSRHGGEEGGPDWQIIRRLCLGSIPAALIVLFILSRTDTSQIKSGLVMVVLGAVLILTGIATLFRGWFHKIALNARLETANSFLRYQPALTVAAGAILGTLVTLTSVGAGALGATLLLALYPLRMRLQRLVATDIIHAVPLTLVAGLGHLWLGNVNIPLLLGLLAGSIPGIIIGSLLASRVSDKALRPVLALVLLFVGARMMLS